MKTYEQLLNKAYEKVKIIERNTERFEIPKVEGRVEGKNTIIINIKQIADYLRRDLDHLSRFIQREMAVYGKIDNERLILNSKLNSIKVNERIEKYAKEFVICPECKKPDTEIVTEKSIKYKHCLACGAKSPIKLKV